MKQGKPLSILSAALLGLSAAAAFAVFGANSIAAEAADYTYGDFQYSYTAGNPNATLKKYLGSDTSVTISGYVPSPDGWKTVTAIGDHAFVTVKYQSPLEPKNITSVSIPNTVTSIGDYAFYGNPLTSLNLPSNLQSIGSYAFEHCEYLTSVTIPSRVFTIESWTFSNCYRLRQVSLTNVTYIKDGAFADCTDLRSIHMHTSCRAAGKAFTNCASLDLVNGQIPWNKTAFNSSGAAPVLSSNSYIRNLLKNSFSKSSNIRFLNEYCEALCTYIVMTETKPWMSEAVKARVLHDWLINHCEYEDGYDENGANVEKRGDEENHVAPSVFLSYGLNIRGNGIGETVCEGYAKAYKMLLETAGIESYYLSGTVNVRGSHEPHAWNIVKVEGKYYQCDVTWDNDLSSASQISYRHFLKTNAKMKELHGMPSNYNPGVAYPTEHPLLVDWYHNGSYANQHCTNTFSDDNGDGLLDSDLNFDGEVNYLDYQVFFSLYYNGDINIDGQVNEQDNYLAQLYNAIFSGAPLTHEIWLWFCIYANIPG